MLSYGLHLCQLAQEVRRADQGTVFVSWPGVRTIVGNNAVASDEWNSTDHSMTQKHDRHWRREDVCQAWKAGAQHAAVPRQLCENQTFLLKVNPYSVCYCNACVSQSLLMSTWCWGREAGGETTDSCTAQCTYHCISHNQSSKIICLDPSAVCNCNATNHTPLPSPVTQV